MPEKQYPESDAYLNPDIQAQLEAGPGLVTNPAAADIRTADELGSLNNFALHFIDSDFGDIYRERQCFKRFEIVHPEFCAELRETVSVAQRAWKIKVMDVALRSAYELMRQLVDTSDLHAVSKGHVDDYYLAR